MNKFVYTVFLISVFYVYIDDAVTSESSSTIIDLRTIIDTYMDKKYTNILYNPGFDNAKQSYNNESDATLKNIINQQNHTTIKVDELKNQLEDMRNQLVNANKKFEIELIQLRGNQIEQNKIQNLLDNTINELRNELHNIKKDNTIQISYFQDQLYNIKNQLIDTKKELIDKTNRLNDNQNRIVNTENHLDNTIDELKNTKKELHEIKIFNTIQINDFQIQLDNIKIQLELTKRELLDKTNQLNDTQNKFVNTKPHLDTTIEELKNSRYELQNYNNNLINIRSRVSESSPVGAIAFFAQKNAPKGWLVANGEVVSRHIYTDLFASIGTTFGNGHDENTFKLPDLRGEFIRGWSNGRDVDSRRDFGSFQWGSIIPITGYINNKLRNVPTTGYTDQWEFTHTSFDEGFEKNVEPGNTIHGTTFPHLMTDYLISKNRFGHISTWNIMKGTRPRNIALLACIKH